MIGEVLRLIRVIEGIKANDMAKKLGISPSYLSLIENEKKRPSVELIEKFAGVIGVRPSQVMFFYEELNNPETTNSNILPKMTRPLFMKWLKGMANHNELPE